MGFTVGAVLLVGAVVFYILQPVLTGMAASLRREDDEISEVEARRRVTLKALRDVEYDFHTGKLDDKDYQDLRRELSAEALEAMEAADREADAEAVAEALEAEIRQVRKGLKGGLTCRGCGHVNQAGSRFCAACGGSLQDQPSGVSGAGSSGGRGPAAGG